MPKNITPTFQFHEASPQYNSDYPFKVKHILIDIYLDFEAETVEGTSKITIQPKTANCQLITLNAMQMEIKQVRLNSQSIDYDYDGCKINIDLAESQKLDPKSENLLEVDYKTVKPASGLTFVKPTKEYPDKPIQAWTQGESQDSRYWYPSFDSLLQISTSQTIVHVPANLKAVSNGQLLQVRQESYKDQAYKAYHWQQTKPHPNYLIAVAVGDFAEVRQKYGDLEVNYYTDLAKKDLLELNAHKTPKMIEFFEKKFGVRYPWSKYSQAWIHEFVYGGMENTSITINTDRALGDSRALLEFDFSEILIAHELAHQWFGDLVVIDHWSSLWVKEGAATYSEAMWWLQEYGQEEFDYYRYNQWQEYFSESAKYMRPTQTNLYKHPEDLYDRHSYTKAGTFYHILWANLGDELFTKSVAHFLDKNRHQNVDGIDLMRSIRKVTGRNLKPLFDQYIYTEGHPELEISNSWDTKHKAIKLQVIQKQAKQKDHHHHLFNLSMPVVFGFVDSSTKEVSYQSFDLQVAKLEQDFYLPLDKKPSFISFDHGNHYLKSIKLKYDFESLKNQLIYDKDVISRCLAAKELGQKNDFLAFTALKEALNKESFWGVRKEIVKALAQTRFRETLTTLQKALEDKNPKVRTAVARAIGNIHTLKAFEILKNKLDQPEENYFTTAETLNSLGVIGKFLEAKQVEDILQIYQQTLLKDTSWDKVVGCGALSGASNLNFCKKAAELIIKNTAFGLPLELRIKSISLLGKVSQSQDNGVVVRILDILDNLSSEKHVLIQLAIVMSCSQIFNSASLQILDKVKANTIDGRVKRSCEEATQKILKNIKASRLQADLHKELDRLKEENKEIRSQLAKILS
jgi:aminopeptidase N